MTTDSTHPVPERELLGSQSTSVASRDFNFIGEISPSRLKKTSHMSLRGEIYWYTHVPHEVRDLFPGICTYDREHYRWYIMDKVGGCPVSNMLIENDLDESMFDHVLSQLDRIHQCPPVPGDIDIYANYLPKLENRYSEYDYSIFTDSKEIFEYLCVMLQRYQDLGLGVKSVIHGDPVFTNILITNRRSVKYIDMRGQVGRDFTIMGDRNYDYAKIYQSIVGYDHVLLNEDICEADCKALAESFFRKIDNKYHYWIPILTMSLLFSLIPLHKNEKCDKYFDLLHRIWRRTQSESD